jgi:hypothetical protein
MAVSQWQVSNDYFPADKFYGHEQFFKGQRYGGIRNSGI